MIRIRAHTTFISSFDVSVFSAIDTRCYIQAALFGDGATSTDIQLDLSTLVPDDATTDTIFRLVTSFENDDELFKSNYTKVLETIEHLVLIDKGPCRNCEVHHFKKLNTGFCRA